MIELADALFGLPGAAAIAGLRPRRVRRGLLGRFVDADSMLAGRDLTHGPLRFVYPVTAGRSHLGRRPAAGARALAGGCLAGSALMGAEMRRRVAGICWVHCGAGYEPLRSRWPSYSSRVAPQRGGSGKCVGYGGLSCLHDPVERTRS